MHTQHICNGKLSEIYLECDLGEDCGIEGTMQPLCSTTKDNMISAGHNAQTHNTGNVSTLSSFCSNMQI